MIISPDEVRGVKFQMTKSGRLFVVVVSVAAIAVVWSQPPIAQDVGYHLFADTRNIFSIPNFWNVLSNLPFLLIGLAGLYGVLVSKQIPVVEHQKLAYILFFSGVLWVAVGSGYYHLWPDNSSLLWDRLPMTVAFMSLFSIIISELVSTRYSKPILGALLLFGLFSVIYWHVTELNGAGDLRLYILVQFLPIVLIPLLLVLCRGRSTNIAGYWLLLLWYAIAKVCEYFDHEIFDVLVVVSGHSLKHIAAAVGVLFLLLAYRKAASSLG